MTHINGINDFVKCIENSLRSVVFSFEIDSIEHCNLLIVVNCFPTLANLLFIEVKKIIIKVHSNIFVNFLLFFCYSACLFYSCLFVNLFRFYFFFVFSHKHIALYNFDEACYCHGRVHTMVTAL